MVEMYEENIEGIQVIHAVPAGQYQQQLPTIFFYHGFLSSKEMYSYFGYTLAKAGFRVILPDALMHGARAESDEAKCVAHFWRILQNNVEELAMLKELFVGRGLADPQRLGVGGVSMGGMTTMAALVKYPWVKVAANLMGSGYFSRLSHHLFPAFTAGDTAQRDVFERDVAPLLSLDVTGKTALFAHKPLFVWHGEQDDVVPFGESLRLQQELAASEATANLTFISESEAKHKVTVHALSEATAFFAQKL
ncbi:esterase [Rahnella sp. FC061912-K]|uniref:esterase n=1 Tax=Rahnella rivi TaxID=2816249 RepID=UPI001C27CA05|nr:esterase [Rahnella rivi]MBU9828966.1 esterase [Rahnella rivi]